MQATRIGTLLRVALVVFAVVYVIGLAADAAGVLAPRVPWSAAGLFLLLIGLLLAAASWVRGYLRDGLRAGLPRESNPAAASLRVARLVAVAKASALAGAASCGGYAAVALGILTSQRARSGVDDAALAQAVSPGVTAAAALACVAAALVLEHACRNPQDPADAARADAA